MSYTLCDWHYDQDHTRQHCGDCALHAAQAAAHREHERWVAAMAGWTCLGCGAEVDERGKLKFSDGCARCRPMVEVLAAPHEPQAWKPYFPPRP